jgi:aryl-alcohol dehydrogenase-like predicted oxidoreductase
MQYRKFGNTDLNVSEIGFGAWAIGGGAMAGKTAIGWGDADDNESEKALYRSLDAGINFFDTADVYGLGHSEELIGKTIANESGVLIATKVGNLVHEQKFTVDYTRKYIVAACEASLNRLKRDSIDYYQLHSARVQHLLNGECIEAMELLAQQGKIRYWGLSLNTFDPQPEALNLLEKQMGSGFQLVLNLINQHALPLMRECAKNGYGIIARMPLQFGLLTGKFDRTASFAENDHRKGRLTKEIIDSSARLLSPVWQLCEKYEINKTQLALSYILSHPEVSVIIPGIRTVAHVDANTNGLVHLDEQDISLIEELNLAPLMEMIRQQG